MLASHVFPWCHLTLSAKARRKAWKTVARKVSTSTRLPSVHGEGVSRCLIARFVARQLPYAAPLGNVLPRKWFSDVEWSCDLLGEAESQAFHLGWCFLSLLHVSPDSWYSYIMQVLLLLKFGIRPVQCHSTCIQIVILFICIWCICTIYININIYYIADGVVRESVSLYTHSTCFATLTSHINNFQHLATWILGKPSAWFTLFISTFSKILQTSFGSCSVREAASSTMRSLKKTSFHLELSWFRKSDVPVHCGAGLKNTALRSTCQLQTERQFVLATVHPPQSLATVDLLHLVASKHSEAYKRSYLITFYPFCINLQSHEHILLPSAISMHLSRFHYISWHSESRRRAGRYERTSKDSKARIELGPFTQAKGRRSIPAKWQASFATNVKYGRECQVPSSTHTQLC